MTENATDRTVTESTTKKHDFTIGTVSGSIVRLSLPMILAQLVNVLYNIVDRMYLGHMPGDGRSFSDHHDHQRLCQSLRQRRRTPLFHRKGQRG